MNTATIIEDADRSIHDACLAIDDITHERSDYHHGLVKGQRDNAYRCPVGLPLNAACGSAGTVAVDANSVCFIGPYARQFGIACAHAWETRWWLAAGDHEIVYVSTPRSLRLFVEGFDACKYPAYEA